MKKNWKFLAVPVATVFLWYISGPISDVVQYVTSDIQHVRAWHKEADKIESCQSEINRRQRKLTLDNLKFDEKITEIGQKLESVTLAIEQLGVPNKLVWQHDVQLWDGRPVNLDCSWSW